MNEATGMEIDVGKKGIKETLGSGKRFQTLLRKLKELKIATLRSLPEHGIRIIEKNSQLLSPAHCQDINETGNSCKHIIAQNNENVSVFTKL